MYPVLFAPKKVRVPPATCGLSRFDITAENRYPLPLTDELMDSLSGATVFSKVDIRDAYHRIRIRRTDIWKAAFRTRYGHYEYLVMAFGLSNAPATFQNYIHQPLKDFLALLPTGYHALSKFLDNSL